MKHVSELSPDVVGKETVEPDATGVFRAISRIGYSLEEALADIVDNSVDANASTVLIRFFRNDDRLTDLAIVDGGKGMSEKTLQEAMRFGSRDKKSAADLGKYGMGLKSASFSQADTLVVVSRHKGVASGRRWTAESIQAGWKLEKLDRGGATRLLTQDWSNVDTSANGTVVLWERIHRFVGAQDKPDKVFGALSKSIKIHLGLVFHRYLQDGRLTILMDLHNIADGQTGIPLEVNALNPFPKDTGREGYPAAFHTKLGTHGDLEMRAYIWPPNRPDPGYKLGGKVAQGQGFYFFRNDRLIQAGGWNGWRNDAEPHSSLARIEVNLPPTLDDAFAISVQKDGVDAPTDFLDALQAARSGRTSLTDYIRDAIDLYRNSEPQRQKQRPVVGEGLRAGLRNRIAAAIQADDPAAESTEIDIRWTSELTDDEVFRVVVGNRTVLLNEKFRSKIAVGPRRKQTDAPLFKTLLFTVLFEDLLKERSTKALAKRHALVNSLLIAALRES